MAQETQQRKAVNVARSIRDVSRQASLYIPLSEQPAKLPSYLSPDRRSSWHNSAMLAMAFESMTLPTRLKPVDGQQYTLNRLEAGLNSNGHQNIARLQYSVPDSETFHSPQAGTDERIPTTGRDIAISTDGLGENGKDAPNEGLPTFDIDLIPEGMGSNGQKIGRTHVFGQVENLRGDPRSSEPQYQDVADDEAVARKRRRTAGLPSIEKLVLLLHPAHQLLPAFTRNHCNRLRYSL